MRAKDFSARPERCGVQGVRCRILHRTYPARRVVHTEDAVASKKPWSLLPLQAVSDQALVVASKKRLLFGQA